MPVYLKPYESEGIKSASDPERKFIRAVESFIKQSYNDAELVIIADGCTKAEDIYYSLWTMNARIRFKFIIKHPLFSGQVRQTGIDMARGDLICYLDHDDYFGRDHLKLIAESFNPKYDWGWYNDWLIQGKDKGKLLFTERQVEPRLYEIGTSAIVHKKSVGLEWEDGYTHDWRTIQKHLLRRPGVKLPTTQYYVCHFHPIDL
jgi:glycosyltransferase involved in cell wall biosynthesis